jgi:hypothetical protein
MRSLNGGRTFFRVDDCKGTFPPVVIHFGLRKAGTLEKLAGPEAIRSNRRKLDYARLCGSLHSGEPMAHRSPATSSAKNLAMRLCLSIKFL